LCITYGSRNFIFFHSFCNLYFYHIFPSGRADDEPDADIILLLVAPRLNSLSDYLRKVGGQLGCNDSGCRRGYCNDDLGQQASVCTVLTQIRLGYLLLYKVMGKIDRQLYEYDLV